MSKRSRRKGEGRGERLGERHVAFSSAADTRKADVGPKKRPVLIRAHLVLGELGRRSRVKPLRATWLNQVGSSVMEIDCNRSRRRRVTWKWPAKPDAGVSLTGRLAGRLGGVLALLPK